MPAEWARGWAQPPERTVVTGTEEAADAQAVLASVAAPIALFGVGDEGAYRIAVGAGLKEGRAVRTTGPGEEDESFGCVEHVDAALAVFARTTGHVAGARVGWGVEPTVVEGGTRTAKGIHVVCQGNKDSWTGLSRIHFDGFLEKTDR